MQGIIDTYPKGKKAGRDVGIPAVIPNEMFPKEFRLN